MTYTVIDSFTVKTPDGDQTIQAGQIVSLPEEKAAILIKAGKIKPELSEAEQDSFNERASIIEYDAGVQRDQAEDLARHCVRPIPLTYAEPCGKQTPPKGNCKDYSMKLFTPSMDLKPYCLKERKWCYETEAGQRTKAAPG